MKPVFPFPGLDLAPLKNSILLERVRKAWRVLRKSGWGGVKWELGRRSGGRSDYTKWIRRYDTLTPAKRERIAQRVSAMKEMPLISVLMPTYNPNPIWLREAIESVRAQIYPRWELCIADDASASAEVLDILKSYSKRDPRIKVVFRTENGHISASSNSALTLATGTWLALMDHDDLIPEDALYWAADCIAEHPDVRLIYSDEDKIDGRGHRFDPYFKCDWNIDLFCSQNMFSHLGLLATDLVRAAGGFRVGLEGSQDWDLVMRCMERVDARQIRHLPRVLYHWRVHGESTAGSIDAKPYAVLAGERVLNEHFARTGVRAVAEYAGFGYRVRYALPEDPPLVSVIVSACGDRERVRQCVISILEKTTYPRYEVVIAGGGPDSAHMLASLASSGRQPDLRVAPNAPEGFAAANNSAVAHARGEVIALVDGGIEVLQPDWLSEMVSIALQPGVGAVGARLWSPGMTLQHGGVILGLRSVAGNSHRGLPAGRRGYAGRATLAQSFSALSAACMVIRKEIYEQAGGFDDAHLQEEFADVDLCLRLREAGFRNVWTPYAELIHHRPRAARGRDVAAAYMQRRWTTALQNDPAYSPNLSLDREDFSYAWPPRLAPL
jgi:GT2 family glycosyltransferase